MDSLSISDSAIGTARHASRFVALIQGCLNGQALHIEGRGVFNEGKGIVDGRYRLIAVPSRVDPLIFEAVALTGYPSVCSPEQGIANPFHDGDYAYDRIVDFGSFGRITYRALCVIERRQTNAVLKSTFFVNADLYTPALSGDTSLVEKWVPLSHKNLKGSFAITWKTRAGGHLNAQATSNYWLLSPDAFASEPTYSRSITVSGCLDSDGALVIRQHSQLWRGS